MKEFFKILIKCLIVVIFLIPIVLFIWKYEIGKVELDHKKEVSDLIKSTIKIQNEKGLLLPKFVFINLSEKEKNKISDTIANQISDFLISKYLRDTTHKPSKTNPYFILPSKPDKEGRYTLTEEQLVELKGHIDFLTKQVDAEVERTKEEVGRDIDRLNTWVSIWIGVIGFLGIFIPIVINLDVLKSVSDASKTAGDAQSKADEAQQKSATALQKINDKEEAISKIDGIETKISATETKLGELETKSGQAEEKANTAHQKAEEAIKESIQTKYALSVVFAINNLHNLDPETLIQIPGNANKLKMLVNTLEQLLAELNSNADFFENKLIMNCFKQLFLRTQNISYYKFVNQEQTQALNEFSELVANSLENYDKSKFDAIVVGLTALIKKLKGE